MESKISEKDCMRGNLLQIAIQEGLRDLTQTDLNGEVEACARRIPGWGLAGAAGGMSESLGVIPRSLCLNISLGFIAR